MWYSKNLTLNIITYKSLYLSVRPFFARLTAAGRWAAEEGHEDPSKRALGYIYMNLECTFKDFLEIVSSCRFRWAQAPTVNYPGLLTSRHLWILKREKQIV
jgi:hypothetical protein